YKKIEKIASGEMKLDFLDDKVTFNGYEISVGHYLFYFGTFDESKFNSEFVSSVNESIDAVKFGIRLIAKDFIDREEYNSYKHGLRLIPSVSELILADPKTMEVKVKWDLSNSMSFYSKTNNKDEVKIATKLFDTERDIKMTNFCSNMVSNIIFYRNIAMYPNDAAKKWDKIPILFFGKKEIEDCNNINVKIQN